MAWEPMPYPDVYRQARQTVTKLVTGDPGAAERPVPACPEWTVRDLVAHLADICAMAAKRLSGQDPEASFPRVSPDDDRTLSDLLAEWDENGETLDRLAADGAELSRPMVMDVFTHELDIHHALGLPAPNGHPAYPTAIEVVVGGFSAQAQALGLPTLRVETPGAHWTAGVDGPPVATLSAGRHDLFRSLAGRRTHAQIAALSWSADPGPWLPAFAWGPFTPPSQPAEDVLGAP